MFLLNEAHRNLKVVAQLIIASSSEDETQTNKHFTFLKTLKKSWTKTPKLLLTIRRIPATVFPAETERTNQQIEGGEIMLACMWIAGNYDNGCSSADLC